MKMKIFHLSVVILTFGTLIASGKKASAKTFADEEKKLYDLMHEFDQDVDDKGPDNGDQEPRDVFDMISEDDATEEEEQQAGDIIEENDPCNGVLCSAGRACYPNEATGEGECQCIKDCGYEPDPRRKVCTNYNDTYSTDCEVYQQRCFCEEGVEERCTDPEKFKHMHVEYFGECRTIPDCSGEELSDFPRRMREWLFNVMKELGDRRELSYHYQQLKKEAEVDRSKRWSNAAVWKWCDLDAHPHDNVVSRHELFPIRAPLQALEHCISDFLDSCDVDDNHDITLKEWGNCLELKVDDLMIRCDEIKQKP